MKNGRECGRRCCSDLLIRGLGWRMFLRRFESEVVMVGVGGLLSVADKLVGQLAGDIWMRTRFDRRALLKYSGMAAASLALPQGAFALADDAPVAKTTAGKVGGTVVEGINVFKGVPYGGDTAKRRFMAPVAPTPWTGVRDCTAFTTMAPQLAAARAPAGRALGAGRPAAGAAAGQVRLRLRLLRRREFRGWLGTRGRRVRIVCI